MKKVLIVYETMSIGGSTTSLLSILNRMDYQQYEIDLQLKQNGGDLLNELPRDVNLLPPVLPNHNVLRIKKLLSPKCAYSIFKLRFMRPHIKLIEYLQIVEYQHAILSKKLDQEYDIAISFIEFWPTYYVANCVRAKRKIAWIHADYHTAGFIPSLDKVSFKKLDKIVVVAKACAEGFVKSFPEFEEKIVWIENILSMNLIKRLSCEPVDFQMDPEKLNFSTVCRIDLLSKGLDRGVRALHKLNEEGLLENVNWFIIGDGPDLPKLAELIKRYRLENWIILLGKKSNPHKYIKNSDFFFLPSRYEGKPMAVTEAMMLGIPPVVTAYASAREQIENGVDGMILENDDNAIYLGLKGILQNRDLLSACKVTVGKRDYSNAEEFNKVLALFN